MPSNTAYCYPKSVIEHRLFGLVSQLHGLSSRLMELAGRDSEWFRTTKAECDTLHGEIALSRAQLRTHRAAHGC